MAKENDFMQWLGRRMQHAWTRSKAFFSRMASAHEERSSLQRSIFVATIAGVLAGGALGAGWTVSSRMLADWDQPLRPDIQVAERNDGHNRAAESSGIDERQLTASLSTDPLQVAQTQLVREGDEQPEQDRKEQVMERRPEGPSAARADVHPKVDAHPRVDDFPPNQEDQGVEPTLSVGEMIWPVSGSILRPFGWYRHPVFGDWRYTSSIALETTPDDRVVRATMDGRVRDVVNEGGLWRITIEHAGGLISEYEGLVAIDIASYETVDTGTRLGTAPVPGSGRTVAFSLFSGDSAIDPQTVIDGPGLPVLAP